MMTTQLYTSLSEGLRVTLTTYTSPRTSQLKTLPQFPPVLEKLSEDDLYDRVYDLWQSSSSGFSLEGEDSGGIDLLRSSIELVGKEFVWEVAYEEPLPGSSVEERCLFNTRLQDVLDVVLTLYEVINDELSSSSTSAPQLPDAGTLFLPILEDMVDLLTLSTWESLFSWIETRSWRLTENMLPSKGKALTLLKTLNTLLRSVSKTTTSPSSSGSTSSSTSTSSSALQLRARIHIFLSRVYKLSEMSGVNSRGDYAEVETIIEDPVQLDGLDGLGDLPDIYKAIWSLQAYVSQPTIIVPTPSQVAAGHTTTLGEFKKTTDYLLPKLFEYRESSSLSKGKGVEVEVGLQEETLFYPKYTTSSKELTYQLSDTSFRLQIFSQLLIFLNTLQYLHVKDKPKMPKVLQFPLGYTVSTDDFEWTKDKIADINDELTKMGERGLEFKKLMNIVLKNERHHAIWKGAGCYPYDQPSQPIETLYAAEKKRLKANEPLKPYAWNCGTKALSQMNRDPLTSADQLRNFELNESLDSLKVLYDKEDKLEKAHLAQRKIEKDAAAAEKKAQELEKEKEKEKESDKQKEGEGEKSETFEKKDEGNEPMAVDEAVTKEPTMKEEEVPEKEKEKEKEPLGSWVENKASINWRSIRMIIPNHLDILTKVQKGDLPTLLSSLSNPKTPITPQIKTTGVVGGGVEMTRNGSNGSTGTNGTASASASVSGIGGLGRLDVTPTPTPGPVSTETTAGNGIDGMKQEGDVDVKMEEVSPVAAVVSEAGAQAQAIPPSSKDVDGDVEMS